MFCLLSINIGPYSHVNSPAHCWDVTLYLSKTSPLAWPPPITPARTAQPIFHLSPSNWTPDPATDSFPAVPIIINPTANPSLTCTQERKKKKKKEGRSRKRRRSVVKKKSNWESSVSSHRTLKAHPSPSHITPSAEALDPEEKKKKRIRKKIEKRRFEKRCVPGTSCGAAGSSSSHDWPAGTILASLFSPASQQLQGFNEAMNQRHQHHLHSNDEEAVNSSSSPPANFIVVATLIAAIIVDCCSTNSIASNQQTIAKGLRTFFCFSVSVSSQKKGASQTFFVTRATLKCKDPILDFLDKLILTVNVITCGPQPSYLTFIFINFLF